MPSKSLRESRSMHSTKLFSSPPVGLAAVTFFAVFLLRLGAGLNYLINFGLSLGLCYNAIFVANLFVARKFITSKWTLEDESEAPDLTLKTRQLEER